MKCKSVIGKKNEKGTVMSENGGIAISSAHPLQNVKMLLHELRILGERLQHGGVHRNKRCIEVGKIDSQ